MIGRRFRAVAACGGSRWIVWMNARQRDVDEGLVAGVSRAAFLPEDERDAVFVQAPPSIPSLESDCHTLDWRQQRQLAPRRRLVEGRAAGELDRAVPGVSLVDRTSLAAGDDPTSLPGVGFEVPGEALHGPAIAGDRERDLFRAVLLGLERVGRGEQLHKYRRRRRWRWRGRRRRRWR